MKGSSCRHLEDGGEGFILSLDRPAVFSRRHAAIRIVLLHDLGAHTVSSLRKALCCSLTALTAPVRTQIVMCTRADERGAVGVASQRVIRVDALRHNGRSRERANYFA